ncbi:MAG TPA: fatty acid--CoA ligase family protein [Beutenbergiaceae bacterium]|nr:fatty acid--CoA ligase family protein [Beutenbergiaceae bacterium]
MRIDPRRFAREGWALLAAMSPGPGDLVAWGPMWRYRATLPALGLAAARRAGSGVVLIDDRGPLTGVELEAAVWDLVAQIRGQVQSGPPGRAPLIALRCGAHRGFLAAVIAAGVLGLDVLLLPTSTGTEQEREVLRQRPVQLVLTDGQVLSAFQARPPRNRPRRPPRPRRPGRLLLLTSGTTGTPQVTTRAGVAGRQLPTVLSLLAALDLRRGEPVLLAPPLAHGHGLSVLAAALIIGAPPILVHGQRPATWMGLARRHRASALLAVPAQLAGLIEYLDEQPGTQIAALRRIAAGSAPLPQALAARIIDVWGPVLVDYYGTSEAGTATIATSADLVAAPGTVGRAANGVALSITDEHGRRCAPGQVGRIGISSPWRAADSGHLVSTGDVGYLDETGRLFVLHRADDVVVVGGHNVHVGEVREWFEAQPDVEAATVHPVPDPVLGTRLEVEFTGTADTGELLRRARRELGSAAAPRQVRHTDTAPEY